MEVLVVFFAIFLRHFPSLRFMNTAAMAESVSASTKRKFLALDLTKCLLNLTRIVSDNGSTGGYVMELSSIWLLRNVFLLVLF